MAARPIINPWGRGRTNQKLGDSFERWTKYAAMKESLLLFQNGLKAKRLPDRVIAVRSNLDLAIYGDATKGEILLVDCKSFAGRRFGQGMLTTHQRELALRYADHGVTSGFLVHLRELNFVGFYHARLFTGARGGFGPEQGLHLGSLQNFQLSRVWRTAA